MPVILVRKKIPTQTQSEWKVRNMLACENPWTAALWNQPNSLVIKLEIPWNSTYHEHCLGGIWCFFLKKKKIENKMNDFRVSFLPIRANFRCEHRTGNEIWASHKSGHNSGCIQPMCIFCVDYKNPTQLKKNEIFWNCLFLFLLFKIKNLL